MSELQKYISKRIRILRTQSGMTQEQLEEKADLGTNYAYKLENLEPNIKISTLEKIIDALNVDLQTFFDLTLKEESTDLAQLIDTIKSLPEYKQNKVISAINTIINETKKKSGKGLKTVPFPLFLCLKIWLLAIRACDSWVTKCHIEVIFLVILD